MPSDLKQSLLDTLVVNDAWDDDYQHMEFNPHGWLVPSAKATLGMLCDHAHPSVIIEIGSWLGKSTRFFAERCDLVIAVDHWLGSEEHKRKPHRAKMLPLLFDQFLSNCEPQRDKILALRMPSTDAAQLPLPKADLIYIDGSHDEASVTADITNYYGFLADGGIMCGDDYDPSSKRGQGIVRSVRAFADKHGLRVERKVPVWWYAPNKSDSAAGTPSPAHGKDK